MPLQPPDTRPGSTKREPATRGSRQRIAPPRRTSKGTLVALVVLGAAACAPAAARAAEARAEVQINLCSDPKETIRALQLRPDGAPLEVWYFESDDRQAFDRGTVFRLRTTGRSGELTLKVADQDCTRIDPAALRRGGGKCEYDLHGTDFRGAVSLTRELGETVASALVAGRLPLQDALGDAQVRYLREHTTAWPLPSGLAPRGPVRIDAYRAAGGKAVVEVWTLPSGRRYIEMSQKTGRGDALRLRAALEGELARAGAVRCADQSSQAGNKARDLVGRP